MRFAYIETGGQFNEQASRGPNSAKGLFQFVPGTAEQYGIRGRELDAVANTDAAAQLYQDNRRILVNRHTSNGMPYLSGKEQPDGMDLYMAHQQGADGYRSIQSAITHGEFIRPDTRAKIINNVSREDLKEVTGVDYDAFKRLPDREMAQTFSQYWDLISPNPQLDFCCSPANSFVLPMFSMMSDLGAADARSRCEVLSAKTPWRPGIGRV
ncbi:hypothetical protein KWH43_12405 [Xanthomonas campestris pv. heliotropii]|nr:hypothetical protein [Xanthomonas campestris pv. heliotropii]